MYVFDLVCGLLCIATLLAWVHNRWIIALITFWLAFKSKEVAVMLPVVLLTYEYLLGSRRWKRLLPFFAISIVMGLQAALSNSVRGPEYQLHFTLAALGETARFYFSRMFLVPYLGLAIIAFPLIARNRRSWFGLAVFLLFLLPMMFLPGRLFAPYLYVPLIGVAILAASLTRTWPVAAAFAVVWIAWNLVELRVERGKLIEESNEYAAIVRSIANYIRGYGAPQAVVYEGDPESRHAWGVFGAVRYYAPEATFCRYGDPCTQSSLAQPAVAVFEWVDPNKRLAITGRTTSTIESPYVAINSESPLWQFGEGWYALEWSYRWIAPHAVARLRRPADAHRFEVRALVSPELLAADKEILLTVSFDGRKAEQHVFKTAGAQTVDWPLEPGPASAVQVTFDVAPAFYPKADSRHGLGIAIQSFGFVP
jgi:hypothetical protein